MPDVLVTAVTVVLPANVELAPLAGAANVTVTFATGFEDESVTFACRALAKDVPTVVVSGLPEYTVTFVGAETPNARDTAAPAFTRPYP